VFSALEVCYENALYKFTFDIDIDCGYLQVVVVAMAGVTLGMAIGSGAAMI